MIKKLFQRPAAIDRARDELDRAKREILDAKVAQEYAAAMAQYHTQRVQLLRAFIDEY